MALSAAAAPLEERRKSSCPGRRSTKRWSRSKECFERNSIGHQRQTAFRLQVAIHRHFPLVFSCYERCHLGRRRYHVPWERASAIKESKHSVWDPAIQRWGYEDKEDDE